MLKTIKSPPVMTTMIVCIPTYKRNLQLKSLLADLAVQTHPAPGKLTVSLLVIDNNPDQRARAVVEAFSAGEDERFEIRYLHEAEPGVVHVRNRALQAAEKADFLVFIDDDERPEKDWLKALWQRWLDTGADVIFGSVEARYADGAPDWVLRGDFHSKLAPEDVIRNRPGATDNCLIDLRSVRDLGLSFDPALSLVGGEDTLFFDGMLRNGATFADAASAVTYEAVPEDRATLEWLVRRWRRTGFTDALMVSLRRPEALRRPAAFIDGAVRIVAGGALTGLAYLFSGFRMHERVARFLYTYQRGRGMISFSLDEAVEEYARPQSDAV